MTRHLGSLVLPRSADPDRIKQSDRNSWFRREDFTALNRMRHLPGLETRVVRHIGVSRTFGGPKSTK